MKNLTHRGFTLIEALVSLGIGALFITGALSAWFYSTKSWKEENINSEMRYNVQKAMEKMKEDIRLTDGNSVLFYPAGSSVYTAVSLSRAKQHANGFFNVASLVAWDQTVIYHVYNNAGTDELRRTVFESFSSNPATRQTQLDSVVTSGSDPNATTTKLFSANSLSLQITPTSPTFDAYSAAVARSSNTSFGNIQLSAGTHHIRFQITGKNASSSGYRMGFDQLSLSPSGGTQEAEGLPVSAHSGGVQNSEDMSSYASSGPWTGNYQMEYQSAGINNYIEFQTYYDQWMESNFANMTHSLTEVTGANPAVSISSRENQALLPSWKADAQTGADPANNPSGIYGETIRDVIQAGSITKPGRMIRLKFMASSSGTLTIGSAYLGSRTPNTPNGSGWAQLYFNNGTVPEGSPDGVGAVGSVGPTGITIQPGYHAWTNWIDYPVSSPGATDYLVSFTVPNIQAEGDETYWDAGSGTHSYTENNGSPTGDWTPTDPDPYLADTSIHAVAEISTWDNVGVATSQVYDTKLTAPAYGQLSWTTNGSGTYSIKVRSSNSPQMVGAPAWDSLAAHTSSPASLATANQRYVQFQATLTASSPYTTYPQLDNVTITWPGQTAIVDISGYYTKRPNYGIFKVLLDGNSLTNALEVTLNASKSFQGKNHDSSLTAQVKAKNTGK